jgi:hypothetical protein
VVLGPETISHAELQLIQKVKEMTNTTPKNMTETLFFIDEQLPN